MLYPSRLPDFPWDSLIPLRERARSYPGVLADLSIGTPVDPSPRVAIEALIEAADSPGYPPTVGTEDLREAMISWWSRVRGAPVEAVLPTIGSKEMVALLPALLPVRDGDTVLIPHIAYPTYEVGATLAGAVVHPIDPASDPATWPEASLVWLNSPANPHGHVLDVDQLVRIVAWARQTGAMIAADECYAGLAWAEPYASRGVPSLLSEEVSGGDHTGLLALYSLSKQSNLAGYRAAMIAGDPDIIARLTELRKHAGMMIPGPVQHAMAKTLSDDRHVASQRGVYARRREILLDAVTAAGLIPDPDTVAGLYLWLAKDGMGAWDIVSALADRGILVAPGTFYGPDGARHVRMALTGTDEAIEAAAERLAASPL